MRVALPWANALYAICAVMAFVPGLELVFGPERWHTSPSYGVVAHAPLWDLYGSILMLVGILVMAGLKWRKVQLAGFYLGFATYAYFAIGTWTAVFSGERVQANTPPNFTVLAVLYLVSLRWATYRHVEQGERVSGEHGSQ